MSDIPGPLAYSIRREIRDGRTFEVQYLNDEQRAALEEHLEAMAAEGDEASE